jgi:hypothetical protein
MSAGKVVGEVLKLGQDLVHELPALAKGAKVGTEAAKVGTEAAKVGTEAAEALEAMRADALPAPGIVDSSHLGSTIGPGKHTFTVGNNRPFGLLVPESMPESMDPKQGTALGYLFDGVTGANDFTFGNMLRQLRIEGADGLAEKTGTPFVTVHPDIKQGMIGGFAKVRAWELGDPSFGLTRQVPGRNDITDYLQKVHERVDGMLPTNAAARFGVAFSEGPWIANRWQVAEGEKAAFDKIGTALAQERPAAQPQAAAEHGFFSDLLYLHPTIGVKDLDALRTGHVPKTNVVIVMGENDKMLPPGKRMPAGNPYHEGGRGLMTALMPEAAKSRPQLVEEFWRRANLAKPGNVVESNDVFDQTRYVGTNGHEVNVFFLKGRQAMHGFHGSPDVQPIQFRYTGQQLPAHIFDAQKLILDYMPLNRNGRRIVPGSVASAAAVAG